MVLPVAALLVAAFALDRMWSGPPQPDFDQDQIELGPPVKPSRSESPLPSEAHNGEGGPTTATPPQTDDDVDIDATTDAPMAITEKDTVEPTAPVEGTTAPTEPEEPPSKRDASAEPPADEPSVDANTPGAALPAAGPPAMDGANTIPAEADTEGEAEPATVESDGAVEQP